MSYQTNFFKILCEIVSILYVWGKKPDEKLVFGQKDTRNHKKTHQSMLETNVDGRGVVFGGLGDN